MNCCLTHFFFISEYLGGSVSVAGPLPTLVVGTFLVLVCGLANSGVRMRAGGCKQLRLAQSCRAKCVNAASVD